MIMIINILVVLLKYADEFYVENQQTKNKSSSTMHFSFV